MFAVFHATASIIIILLVVVVVTSLLWLRVVLQTVMVVITDFFSHTLLRGKKTNYTTTMRKIKRLTIFSNQYYYGKNTKELLYFIYTRDKCSHIMLKRHAKNYNFFFFFEEKLEIFEKVIRNILYGLINRREQR